MPANVPTDEEFAVVLERLAALERKTQTTYDDTPVRDKLANLEATVAEVAAKVTNMEGDVDEALTSLEEYRLRLESVERRPAGTGLDYSNAINVWELAGVTDDAKLDAAWDLARATLRPMRLRDGMSFTKGGRPDFSGRRILGHGEGWQNFEQGAKLAQCSIILNVGTKGQAWIVGTSTTFDTYLGRFTFRSSNGNTEVIHYNYGSGGNCYAGTFEALTAYGIRHLMGTPDEPFTMTLCHAKGEWTGVAVIDTLISVRGSDNWLWTAGVFNYGWRGAAGGKYLVRLSDLSKSYVSNLYLTARGGMRALLVEGSPSHQGSLFIEDCVIEGQNLNDPAMGALVVFRGNVGAKMEDCAVNFGMARPSDYTDQRDTALVMVMGNAKVIIDSIFTCRANLPGTATPVDVPFVEVSGSASADVSRVIAMKGSSSTDAPAARFIKAGTSAKLTVNGVAA